MKLLNFAKENIVIALNQNSVVEMENVSVVAGDVTMKMIVEICLMKLAVKSSNARMEHSSVLQDIVSLHISDAMVTEIVVICLMKQIARQGSQVAGIAQNQSSNVRIIFVCLRLISAMAVMIVQTVQMKHRMFVRTLTATHCEDSNAQTIDVYQGIYSVMALITVEMEVMKMI